MDVECTLYESLSLNHDITSSSLRLRSQVYPKILKIHPLPAQAYTVRVDPYAHS